MRGRRRGRRLVATAAALFFAAGVAGADTSRPVTAAALEGACYCRAENRLQCLGVLAEPECARRCAEALCDDWFWLERRPCWNWGYGG